MSPEKREDIHESKSRTPAVACNVSNRGVVQGHTRAGNEESSLMECLISAHPLPLKVQLEVSNAQPSTIKVGLLLSKAGHITHITSSDKLSQERESAIILPNLFLCVKPFLTFEGVHDDEDFGQLLISFGDLFLALP